MPRPRVDNTAIRNRIVDIAETLLVESSGRRLVLSDIAARMGVSQPYVYRHFKNKQALVGELAMRWFEKIETAGDDICTSGDIWQDKLRAHILTTLKLKRQAYDANPELFAAYLRLAGAYPDSVQQHVQILTGQMRRIIAPAVAEHECDELVNLVLDATVQFRVPSAIMDYPAHATAPRAALVLEALIEFIERRSAMPPRPAG